MSALDTFTRIISNNNLCDADLKYCYVDASKVPHTNTGLAKPDTTSDFVRLSELNIDIADKYAGLGISIQANEICAIDVDDCFEVANNFETADDRAKTIVSWLKDYAYIEFSFSGKGLRALFKANLIPDYSKKYYTKNSKTHCEYYFPEASSRYVTITGNAIISNPIQYLPNECLYNFLTAYMLKPVRIEREVKELCHTNTEEMLKHYLRSDKNFQNNWFDTAPGSGSNESERDFWLIQFIFDNITHDKSTIKTLFERSPFYKSKDYKHKLKWERNDNRYFNYLYDVIAGG